MQSSLLYCMYVLRRFPAHEGAREGHVAPVHAAPVSSAAFLRDDRRVLTATHGDGCLMQWRHVALAALAD